MEWHRAVEVLSPNKTAGHWVRSFLLGTCKSGPDNWRCTWHANPTPRHLIWGCEADSPKTCQFWALQFQSFSKRWTHSNGGAFPRAKGFIGKCMSCDFHSTSICGMSCKWKAQGSVGLRQTRPLICPQEVYIQTGETLKLKIHKKISAFKMNATTKIIKWQRSGRWSWWREKVVLSCDLNDKEKPAWEAEGRSFQRQTEPVQSPQGKKGFEELLRLAEAREARVSGREEGRPGEEPENGGDKDRQALGHNHSWSLLSEHNRKLLDSLQLGDDMIQITCKNVPSGCSWRMGYRGSESDRVPGTGCICPGERGWGGLS